MATGTVPNSGAPNNSDLVQSIAAKAKAKEDMRKRAVLVKKLEDGQLALWTEGQRGIPNEFVRCALFPARNRNATRCMHSPKEPLRIPIIGGGEVVFVGEEFRQDDETVFMQLVHLSKVNQSCKITFKPSRFMADIGWPRSGASYDRLLTCIRRLHAASISLYSNRLDRGTSMRLIAGFEYTEKDAGQNWSVTVFDQESDALKLFETHYSRLDWDIRRALPDGIATWLHGYYSSHNMPYSHRLDTLISGAGLLLKSQNDDPKVIADRLREAKKTIKQGLQNLVDQGFLTSFTITRAGLVSVVRA